MDEPHNEERAPNPDGSRCLRRANTRRCFSLITVSNRLCSIASNGAMHYFLHQMARLARAAILRCVFITHGYRLMKWMVSIGVNVCAPLLNGESLEQRCV